jgi:hypothetical protein
MLSWLVNRITSSPPVSTIRLFKAAMYGWLLFNTLFLLPIAGDIWGPNALIAGMQVPENVTYQFFYMLMYDAVNKWYYLFIALQLSALFVWFSGKWQRLAAVIIYLVTIILFLRAYLYVTGGHRLLQMFLFFFIFIDENKTDQRNIILTNLFFLACIVQLLLVYLYAGLFKLHGDYWMNGEALYYVLSIREFSHPAIQHWLLDKTSLLKAGTYVALCYQLLFPILVWFKKIRWPFLIIGVAFHLMVAIVLGLPDFGILMVLSYTMFLKNDTAAHVLAKIRFQPRSHFSSKSG